MKYFLTFASLAAATFAAAIGADVQKRCVGLGGLCYASEQCCNGYGCVLNSSGSGTCAYLSPPKAEEREVEKREAEKNEDAVSKRCIGLGGLCYASEQCCNGYGCVLNSSGSGTCAYLSPPAETEKRDLEVEKRETEKLEAEKREAEKAETEKRCVGLGGLCYASEQCCNGYGCVLNSSGSGTCAYLSPPVNKRCVGLGGLCYASEQCCDGYGCVLNSSGSGNCAYLSPPAQ